MSQISQPYQGSYVQFNVPRTQQIYLHHNHSNDRLYGYDRVPVQNNYNTVLNTAIEQALTTTGGLTGAQGTLDDANDARKAEILLLAADAIAKL